ncbi:adenylyltransferase [Alicycliphilus sp. B1]|nr:adenylyltransferase [Alicycliphilus sp. B1]
MPMPCTESVADSGPLSHHSRFHQRLGRRYGAELALLAPGVPDHAAMDQACESLLARGHDLGAALRILRQLVMHRLITLDCDQGAVLSDITLPVTALAELALDRACRAARAELDARHGAPLGPQGQPVQLWVVGMGKLGARELNVSSDIDLVYVYEHDGETAGLEGGRGRLSNHEYFARAVKAIYALVGETTEHGFVFRVDLALRPHGNSGPAALSLSALEDYLQVHGREWERFAWLKSRVVAPLDCHRPRPTVQALRGVVLPFVFRRYLDYACVRRAARAAPPDPRPRRAAQRRPPRARQRREALARRHPRDRVHRAAAAGGARRPVPRAALPPHAGRRSNAWSAPASCRGRRPRSSAAAYTFLRRVEHRIQYLDDQQTHVLPTRDEDLAWIARTMGLSCCDFLRELDAHRELVAQEFDTLLGGAQHKRCGNGGCGKPRTAEAPAPELEALLEQLAVPHCASAWPNGARTRACRACATRRARGCCASCSARPAGWPRAGSTRSPAVRLVGWLEPLLRRESYLALLLERPLVHERLLHLLGAAKWPARYMLQHPGVIDELASEALLSERFVAADFEHELGLRLAALQSTGEDDDENLLDLLRRAHHAEIFRTLARDVEGRITVEQVADDLSALADSVLRVTAQWCWGRLRNRHRTDDGQPQFAIIGYGKLGGKELGYGSDLDIVFVFDDDDERAPEVYAAFVRKLINWLTVKTGEGDLFEIDTALRPNGNSGLLVTSFKAYADYQQQRGSNTAWTWEHQAMTRARFVLGSEHLRARFDAVREAVITAPRDRAALRTEIIAMRERMRAAHPVPAGLFDVKHSEGGMVDAEFAVQYLGAVAVGGPLRAAGQPGQHRRCCSTPKAPACCRPAWAAPPPTPTARCARCSTARA